MKLASVLAFVLAFTLIAGIADAKGNKGNKADKQNLVSGQISAIDGSSITIHPKADKKSGAAPADIVVVTTDSTVVLVDGAKKALADLAVGQIAKISLDADGKTALSFDVKTKSKKNAPPAAPAAPATPPAADPAK